MLQNFLSPQRDQPLLLPVDMREWLPEDDLVFIVLDAVAKLDLDEFRRRYRADGHGRAAFDPEMMVALLLYGYCQGERSSRVIEKWYVRDVAYRVIAGGLRPDHATIARFRVRHEQALGGLFSQVLRLLAAEGMVSLGTLSLDGTKLAGSAAQKANKTLPQIEKILAEAAAADAAEDARYGDAPGEPTPGALARQAERRERLARLGTGWRLRTRRAGMRSGRSSRPGRRPRRSANGAGTALAMSRAPTGPTPSAGEHHRPGRAGDAQPERLRRRVHRPGRGHRGPGHRRRDAQPAPGRPHPAAPTPGYLPPAAGPGRARRFRGTSARRTSPAPTRTSSAARAAGQRPRPAGRAPSPKSQAPRPVSGHRPRYPAPAASPRPGGLQAAGPHRGTQCSGSSRPARN